MSRKAITLELESANLLWLEDQAATSGRQTLSEVINEILAKLRGSRADKPSSVESIREMIEISDDDPNLEGADEALRALFAESLGRDLE